MQELSAFISNLH